MGFFFVELEDFLVAMMLSYPIEVGIFTGEGDVVIRDHLFPTGVEENGEETVIH